MPVLDMFQYQGQCCLVLSYMPNTLYSFLELHPIDQTFIDSIAGSATTNTVPTATSTNTITLPTIIPSTLILPLPSSSGSSNGSALKQSIHTKLPHQYDTHTSIPTNDTDTQTHNNTHINSTHINQIPNKIQHNKHDFNIDSDIIRKIALNIITSLYILHTNNIVHCDIKPENCFINTVYTMQKGHNSDPNAYSESAHNDTHTDNNNNNDSRNNTSSSSSSSNILPNKRVKSSYDTSSDSHTSITNYSSVETKTVPVTNSSSGRNHTHSSPAPLSAYSAAPSNTIPPPILDRRTHTTHTATHTTHNTTSTAPSSSSSAALYSTAPTSDLSSYSSVNTYITLGDMGSSIHTSELPGYYTDFNIQSLPYRAPEVRAVYLVYTTFICV